jgi:hypothetical protein
LADLTFDHLQRREDRWAIVDLVGKGGHVRTVPVPDWVKRLLDEWFTAAEIPNGKLFRCVCRSGKVWGDGMTEKVVWHVVKTFARNWMSRSWRLTISGDRVPDSVTLPAEN